MSKYFNDNNKKIWFFLHKVIPSLNNVSDDSFNLAISQS